MIYTNNHKIPLPLAVFLATNDYDPHQSISATSLIRPLRQLILSQRVINNSIDISSLVSARMGSAIHTAIEQAWKEPQNALQALGYTDDVISRIRINPSLEELTEQSNIIPVYMEQRSYKEINGYMISGKYDFVAEGRVHDFKSTSVYTYLNQSNVEKYQLQGSIYRLLNPEIITDDYMYIHYIFTDWSKVNSYKPNYPQSRVLSQKIPLLSIEDTQAYIESKLQQYDYYKDLPETSLPLCSDNDLWRKPTVWKYYKNPSARVSTKNFDNPSQAYALQQSKGCGEVREVKGLVSACKYCPAFDLCSQKDILIQNGELEP